ncbi:MAG: sulfotransferase [Actinomycetia bacterium]|nr:sulfotransferase [Actinomycetes bacterium]MCP4960674.1 sulfotransferase [Actinomycetes bacterium]
MTAEGLPDLDFFVIGAYKAATTTLHYALRSHPDVFVPRRKEPSYLAYVGLSPEEVRTNPAHSTSVTSRDEYRSLYERPESSTRLCGDVSPEYLKNERCAATIKTYYPQARLIAILREPVSRAFSDYLMYRRDGLEPLDEFAAALDDQANRSGQANGQYLETGMYGKQLARYYDLFDDDQILVLLQEDLKSDRDIVLARLADFLNISPTGFEDSPDESNRSGVPTSTIAKAAWAVRRSLRGTAKYLPEDAKRFIDRQLQKGLDRPELSQADRTRLAGYFWDDIERVEALTDLDLSRWKVTAP